MTMLQAISFAAFILLVLTMVVIVPGLLRRIAVALEAGNEIARDRLREDRRRNDLHRASNEMHREGLRTAEASQQQSQQALDEILRGSGG